ncbi:DEAD/DEAH box helicase [Moritella dasanensis]|uniref:DEAD/DEAH box helicase n=1 Tax=Moritella dasanensis TaxID=428031 RepID=UPI0002DB4F99|nr:DEAD/DEAH box helicase [Moritella dasanensis]
MSEFKGFSLLESIIDRVNLKGYKQPTPIQKECIPALINGHDLLGIAQTGTGKTAAFSLPIINHFGRNNIDIESTLGFYPKVKAHQDKTRNLPYKKGVSCVTPIVIIFEAIATLA